MKCYIRPSYSFCSLVVLFGDVDEIDHKFVRNHLEQNVVNF